MYKYKRVRIKKGVTRDQHRLMMEEHLERKLKRNEVVHHINGDGKDNRLENLQVMTLSEHARMHMENQCVSKKTREKLRQATTGKPRTDYKYNPEQIFEIILLKQSGKTSYQISKLTGIPKSTVIDIMNEKYLCYRCWSSSHK